MSEMSRLRRAWTAFRSRPRAEQLRLLRRAAWRLRAHGLSATLAWARASGAESRDGARYEAWCRRHTPDAARLAIMRAQSGALRYQPLISIITAAYNTEPALLEAAAASVIGQAYPRWEWHIADDGSTHAPTVAALAALESCDPRISVHRASVNGGISAASNLALAHAAGEYIALLDHDDVLMPQALFRVVECLNGPEPAPDVVYSDEDKLDLDGRRTDPYFKPDWSPDLFRSSMYACHLLVLRRSLALEVGGFRSAFDYSQDYDLLLRIVERTARIAHVPDVLYHWRKTLASTALSGGAKPTAHAAGARALQAHLDRQDIAGRILDAGPPGLYRVQYAVAGDPLVSIVMPTRDPAGADLARTLDVIARTTRSAVEVVLVSSSGAAPERLPSGLRLQSVRAEARFAFPAWVNLGARVGAGQHLLVMHDDVAPLEEGWLQALVELSEQPWVGAVGAKLVAEDGSLRHTGLIVGLGGLADSPFRGHAADTAGYFSGANCIRNYTAVSGACLMTRREVFDRVGGFEEALSGPGADVDYGLRVTGAGLLVVFTPYARLAHLERGGISGRELTPAERRHLECRWGERLRSDPFYNPNLTLDDVDYSVVQDEGGAGTALEGPATSRARPRASSP
jgi:GT2 family glycosyltransferase